MKRQLISENEAASCYFKSSVEVPYRKALVQITERCNLHCVHCFVSAKNCGGTMSLATIRDVVIPRLRDCRVIRVSLTGGEPFMHDDIIEIVRLLRGARIQVGICTNATCVTNRHIKLLASIGGVHCNVSLDGFSSRSHGKFRGNVKLFEKTIKTISALGRHGLLQGVLVTPNNFAEITEYSQLCEFAIQSGAEYVLMNPLSSMGRGVKSIDKFAASDEAMRQIRENTKLFSQRIKLAYVRFPNDERLPLTSCDAGNIIYIFTNGELAICPYLVFAAKTKRSLHRPDEFIIGNIFRDANIAEALDAYKFQDIYKIGDNATCNSCDLSDRCGKGCPAAVIASGKPIGEVDEKVCPRNE